MLTSFFLMRCSSRSSGPSKFDELDRERVRRRFEIVRCWLASSVRNLHRVAHALHRLGGDDARALRAFEQDLRRRSGFASTAARRSRIGSRCAFSALASFVFTSTSPTLPGAVARLQIVDLGRVRVERVVIDEHRIAFDGAGNVGADALRIRVHLHHLLLHLVGACPTGGSCCRGSCSSSCRRRARAAGRTSSAAAAARRAPRPLPKTLLKRRTTSRASSRCAT